MLHIKSIFAGKAIFTIRNERNGGRFTYKVTKHKDIWFVGVLTGSDNKQYSYLGTVFPDGFKTTRKSKIPANAPSFKVFSWLCKREELPEHIKIYHEGRCMRCGRRLTVPESIESGFGPECVEKVAPEMRK